MLRAEDTFCSHSLLEIIRRVFGLRENNVGRKRTQTTALISKANRSLLSQNHAGRPALQPDASGTWKRETSRQKPKASQQPQGHSLAAEPKATVPRKQSIVLSEFSWLFLTGERLAQLIPKAGSTAEQSHLTLIPVLHQGG